MTRRGYALLALASAAFTVYGSLVPFRFRDRSWDDAVGAFEWVAAHRAGIESRSDWVANVALGVPLGFSLLGALRTDRPGRMQAVLTAVAVWPACVVFAAGVEFAQLFADGRTCSASDIVAQGLGAAVGLAAWVGIGPTFTRWVRAALDDPRSGGQAGRLVLGYLAVAGFAQLLPLDLTASPADVYRKVRDGRATVVPFADPPGKEPRTGEPEPGWRLAVKWAKVVSLFVPLGLLAARLPRASLAAIGGSAGVVAVGFLAALATELAQLLVQSRHPSTTDALCGGVGVAAGLAAGRWGGPRWLLWLPWLTWLVVIDWLPFAFVADPGPVIWVPFADLVQADYLRSADDLLVKATLFLPAGALVSRPGAAAVVGFAVAAGLEAGQAFLPARDASATDPVLAAVGAWVGAAVAGRTAPPLVELVAIAQPVLERGGRLPAVDRWSAR